MRSTNIVAILLLILSMGIAGVAAYFSIYGLAKMFAAAMTAVIIMAGILELAKLGCTFFLHRYWDELPWWKIVISGMVVILMVLTSMGIFGFLSKGHLEQEAPVQAINLQIKRLDTRIKSYETTVIRENKRLGQLDASIQKLLDFDKVSGPTGSRAVRKEQQPERKEIRKSIDLSYEEINKLQETRLPLAQKVTSIEAELGPIKYVAELFGFDLKNSDGKGKAVRLIIVLLMAAFDPLAIMLIIASDWTFLKDEKEVQSKRKIREDKIKEEEDEKDRKTEEKREIARLKKEEKDRIADEKKEAVAARKEARERQKEVDTLALENDGKRLDLERKRIENDKLRSADNVNMHISDGPVEVTTSTDMNIDLTSNLPTAIIELEKIEEAKPSDDGILVLNKVLGSLADKARDKNEQEKVIDAVILSPVVDAGPTKEESEVIDDGPEDLETFAEEHRETADISGAEMFDIMEEDEQEFDVVDEEAESISIEESAHPTPREALEESIEDLKKLEPEVDLPIIPELEAEYNKEVDIQASADVYDGELDKIPEEPKTTLEEDNPLAFLGEAFDNDKQLINYLINNEDVFNELIKLRDETKDDKIRAGIEKVINNVMKVKSQDTVKGWL